MGSIDFKSLGTTVAINLAIFLAIAVVFSVLRRLSFLRRFYGAKRCGLSAQGPAPCRSCGLTAPTRERFAPSCALRAQSPPRPRTTRTLCHLARAVTLRWGAEEPLLACHSPQSATALACALARPLNQAAPRGPSRVTRACTRRLPLCAGT